MTEGYATERRLATLEEKVRSLEATRDDFVTKDEIGPIRSLVYGAAGTILLAAMTAVAALVFRH